MRLRQVKSGVRPELGDVEKEGRGEVERKRVSPIYSVESRQALGLASLMVYGSGLVVRASAS